MDVPDNAGHALPEQMPAAIAEMQDGGEQSEGDQEALVLTQTAQQGLHQLGSCEANLMHLLNELLSTGMCSLDAIKEEFELQVNGLKQQLQEQLDSKRQEWVQRSSDILAVEQRVRALYGSVNWLQQAFAQRS